MRHDLKIWPQYFCRVQDGSKTFEVRENDRGFQNGDEVVLREFDPNAKAPALAYSGNTLQFKIGYVLPIENNRVVFSLLPAEQGGAK